MHKSLNILKINSTYTGKYMKKMLTAALMVMCLSTGVQAQVETPIIDPIITPLGTAEEMMNAPPKSKPKSKCNNDTLGQRINQFTKSDCEKALEDRKKECEKISGCKVKPVSDCSTKDKTQTYYIGEITCEPK